MLSAIHYLIRSKIDGQYLAARLPAEEGEKQLSYVLVFRENFEALSYLNTHAAELAHHFAVESANPNQLKGILQRWGYQGLGIVEDPLLPRIQFLRYEFA